ncbi:DNA-processing protein DprA [Limosilactobacillus viscerum]|uniref:DNA-processing protein DprA n=1 Tax=Limosilactobacillus viscerum TaxID=2993450 RepID=UPI0024BB6028|nr:DNA-processing protein DprA [Limosilactobacillus viscerum]
MLTVREFLQQLSLCRGLGRVSKMRLWQVAQKHRCFSRVEFLAEQAQLGPNAKEALLNNWASEELAQTVELNQQYPQITIVDEEYPPQLRETFCPPLVLYYQGNLDLLRCPQLGVVGARDMSAYGETVLRGLIPQVAKHQIAVVSGLAKGVDGMSHRLALANNGATIGVIGCGLDRVYPLENRPLYEAVAKQGLILSEYGRGEPPLAYHFPERNRIIAGLSSVVVVIEAKKRSGSLITANLALEENRTVCAVPGRIDTFRSLGCNELIAAGAKPILRAQDLLDEFLS